nr:hypothetical protein BdHM001_36240 [Bdellovibrio sp. HM001]
MSIDKKEVKQFFFFEDQNVKGTYSSVFTAKNLSRFDKSDLDRAIFVVPKTDYDTMMRERNELIQDLEAKEEARRYAFEKYEQYQKEVGDYIGKQLRAHESKDAEIASLRAQVKELERIKVPGRLEVQLKEKNEEIRRLREALKRFGNHAESCVCHIGHQNYENECDCGLDEILKELGERSVNTKMEVKVIHVGEDFTEIGFANGTYAAAAYETKPESDEPTVEYVKKSDYDAVVKERDELRCKFKFSELLEQKMITNVAKLQEENKSKDAEIAKLREVLEDCVHTLENSKCDEPHWVSISIKLGRKALSGETKEGV